MRRSRLLAAWIGLALAVAPPSLAAPSDPLKPLDFLIGHWTAPAPPGDGPSSGGTSDIVRDLGGAVLVRRDHTMPKDGGSLDMLMVIYAEAGRVRADFFDDDRHVIHYAVSSLDPGKKVVFTSNGPKTMPTFRLTYESTEPKTLLVRFELAPPGSQGQFKVYAEGPMSRP
jgi:hypothetical protein